MQRSVIISAGLDTRRAALLILKNKHTTISNMDGLSTYLLTIIPLMVAIDAPGLLPVYLSITEGFEAHEKKKVARQSVLTAFFVTIIFIFLGTAVFNILGILVEDFMIAGGILLLVISVTDMLHAETRRIASSPALGIVPLGTPLLAGPATITTSLVLVGEYGYIAVILSLTLNLLIAWLIFDKADAIVRLMGINGSRAVTRLMSLLLAAIAIKMIRTGIFALLGR
ncbi:MAG: MarC family protein [Nitrospirota bacterium]